MATKTVSVNIGIEEKHRQKIAEGLSRLLADSYTLYLKTHNYHWNVTGPMFTTLHQLFEQHYLELATAVDEIAEKIIIEINAIIKLLVTEAKIIEIVTSVEDKGAYNISTMFP